MRVASKANNVEKFVDVVDFETKRNKNKMRKFAIQFMCAPSKIHALI